MSTAPFIPRYIREDELTHYGLPEADEVSNILSLVDGASVLIDEYCGKNDELGNGSLVWTTYKERLLMEARNRNLKPVNFKPLAAIDGNTAAILAASGSIEDENHYYTGFIPNTIVNPTLGLSPILGASGRYGYGRRGEQAIYPDLNYGINPLMVAAFFGGPPGWTPIDVTAIDFDPQTGELWLPAGLYMSQYTEILIQYNSGFDPRAIPEKIKQACAGILRNGFAKAGFVTGVRSFSSVGSASVSMTEDLIDVNIARLLQNFVNVIAY